VQHCAIFLSSSRTVSAGIGTVIGELLTRSKWLPRLHRAGPSASLDKSIVRIRLWRDDTTGRWACQIECDGAAPAEPVDQSRPDRSQREQEWWPGSLLLGDVSCPLGHRRDSPLQQGECAGGHRSHHCDDVP